MNMRLKFFWWRSGSPSTDGEDNESDFDSSLLEAGQKLRQGRQKLGMSLQELAAQTRITTPVLEAIENGWSERLPEPAYLSAMLPRLERHLELTEGSLTCIFDYLESSNQAFIRRALRPFTPGSIDVFTTWQGSFIYAVLMLISLFALNYQQKHLAEINSQSLQPFGYEGESQKNNQLPFIGIDEFSTLRPISKALDKSFEEWLLSVGNKLPSEKDVGLLQIRLNDQRELKIDSAGGDRLNMKKSKGSITLQLRPPLSILVIPPPLREDRVLWNGKMLEPISNQPGSYKIVN